VIYHALDCSPCRRSPTCNGAYTCLREISPDEVMHEVWAMVREAPGGRL
jgi:heptosyltransferase-1